MLESAAIHMSSSSSYGRSHRSAPALERPRRRVLADRPRTATGASRFRGGGRAGRPRRGRGRGAPVDDDPERAVRLAARRRRARARARGPAPGPCAAARRAGRAAEVMAPGTGVSNRDEPRRPRRRPAHDVLLRRLPVRGRPVQSLLAALPELLPPAPAGGQHAARDAGPPRPARCCATSRASRRCWIVCSTWRSCRSCASTSASARRAPRPAWFRALDDARVGAALRAAARRPAARTWTVADARRRRRRCRARRSRASSPSSLGLAPLAYLNDWRMALAASGCATPTRGLAAIAALTGLRLGVLVRRRLQAPPRHRARTVARRRPEPTDRSERILIRSPACGFPS